MIPTRRLCARPGPRSRRTVRCRRLTRSHPCSTVPRFVIGKYAAGQGRRAARTARVWSSLWDATDLEATNRQVCRSTSTLPATYLHRRRDGHGDRRDRPVPRHGSTKRRAITGKIATECSPATMMSRSARYCRAALRRCRSASPAKLDNSPHPTAFGWTTAQRSGPAGSRRPRRIHGAGRAGHNVHRGFTVAGSGGAPGSQRFLDAIPSNLGQRPPVSNAHRT